MASSRHRSGGRAQVCRRLLKAHWESLLAADCFASEVLAWRGLRTQVNACTKRFVLSITDECLRRLIFLSEPYLQTTLAILRKYHQHGRNHQGIENLLIDPPKRQPTVGRIRYQAALGDMLNGFYREAA